MNIAVKDKQKEKEIAKADYVEDKPAYKPISLVIEYTCNFLRLVYYLICTNI